ncbi:hypothetical protein Phi48:2_gp17 [Cellulophaga phage phi48:2]|uniref:hypothetical protein n=1 Tax=Cellulophaga phage phi48:2 TaxID=1327968 RepID=UPI000351C82C|nr:hypothetical protein Phi48:2_gp17 [Cellulophaga phage phi48:2]AGO47265.1 hypothetical protein Phi48:2_gp17 [Cellulophaga phage phi48:2]
MPKLSNLQFILLFILIFWVFPFLVVLIICALPFLLVGFVVREILGFITKTKNNKLRVELKSKKISNYVN